SRCCASRDTTCRGSATMRGKCCVDSHAFRDEGKESTALRQATAFHLARGDYAEVHMLRAIHHSKPEPLRQAVDLISALSAASGSTDLASSRTRSLGSFAHENGQGIGSHSANGFFRPG